MTEEARLPSRQKILDRVSWIGSVLLLIIAVGAIAVIVFDLSKNFVHPTYLDSILPRAVSNGLSVRWSDVLISMGQFGLSESRPRFLALLIETFDIKLRLFLHNYVLLPPTFSPVSWVLEAVVGPVFLYRLVWNLGGSRTAAMVAVAIYLSSIGFLSGIAMEFIPGKALITLTLIMAMYHLSSIRKANATAVFSDAPPKTIAAVILWVFLGLFLDEVGLFAFVLLPIMFWPLFWARSASPLGVRPEWKGIALFAIPGVAFLLIVVGVFPSLYQHYFHRPFDYFGNMFAIGIGAQGAKSMFVGPHANFGWAVIWENFTNFFGLTLVPVQLSPLNSNLGQTSNVAQLLGLGAFFTVLIICAARCSEPAAWLRRTLIATAAFVVLVTLLSIRHNPIIAGYYYGATISLFIALLVGLAVAVLSSRMSAGGLVGVAAAFAIALIQINNFIFLNDRWRDSHNEHAVRPANEKEFRLAPMGTEVTREELAAIRLAWKEGRLESYISGHTISVGALHLVLELRHIERLRPKSPAS